MIGHNKKCRWVVGFENNNKLIIDGIRKKKGISNGRSITTRPSSKDSLPYSSRKPLISLRNSNLALKMTSLPNVRDASNSIEKREANKMSMEILSREASRIDQSEIRIDGIEDFLSSNSRRNKIIRVNQHNNHDKDQFSRQNSKKRAPVNSKRSQTTETNTEIGLNSSYRVNDHYKLPSLIIQMKSPDESELQREADQKGDSQLDRSIHIDDNKYLIEGDEEMDEVMENSSQQYDDDFKNISEDSCMNMLDEYEKKLKNMLIMINEGQLCIDDITENIFETKLPSKPATAKKNNGKKRDILNSKFGQSSKTDQQKITNLHIKNSNKRNHEISMLKNLEQTPPEPIDVFNPRETPKVSNLREKMGQLTESIIPELEYLEKKLDEIGNMSLNIDYETAFRTNEEQLINKELDALKSVR